MLCILVISLFAASVVAGENPPPPQGVGTGALSAAARKELDASADVPIPPDRFTDVAKFHSSNAFENALRGQEEVRRFITSGRLSGSLPADSAEFTSLFENMQRVQEDAMRVLDLALTKLSERVITGGSLPVKATEGDTDLTCEQACANTGLTLAEEMAGGVSRAVLDKRISCQIEMASELSGRLQAEATEGLADLTCAQAYATAGLTLAKEMAGCVSPVLDKRIPCVTTPSTPRG